MLDEKTCGVPVVLHDGLYVVNRIARDPERRTGTAPGGQFLWRCPGRAVTREEDDGLLQRAASADEV